MNNLIQQKMKRMMVYALLLTSVAGSVYGQWTTDSLLYEKKLNSVLVSAVRVPRDAPFAVTNIDFKIG